MGEQVIHDYVSGKVVDAKDGEFVRFENGAIAKSLSGTRITPIGGAAVSITFQHILLFPANTTKEQFKGIRELLLKHTMNINVVLVRDA